MPGSAEIEGSEFEGDLPVAGTAVVLRDAPEGLQVLLLLRPDRGSFAGSWVFPGGRVEAGDLGDDEVEQARAAAMRETAEEAGIRIRDLVTISCWEPPREVPKRIRTWFFLAEEDGDEVRVNPGEIERALWIAPADALRLQAEDRLLLWPPTWVTLHGLLPHRTVADARAAVRAPEVRRTRILETADGRVFLWEGDEHHPERPGAPGARNRIATERLPWTYQRD
ncbi:MULTISPECIES: NUDIX domain-containing protein [unclassified Microbacterium]|uniref:NUDIX domain-containing protein n=1 Tax=unclassified Microbacterium TaxID=2609290 RepID=UPI0012F8A9CF|nr:NUDIX hydrolase [Microbacterium sp. MAH-37]MVQ41754.1 NUDIX domain-containing protein [Microbacterium sp. MAH-37]